MKHALLLSALLAIVTATATFTQTVQVKSSPEQRPNEPRVVALNTNELAALQYDAGQIKFIATSDDTNGAYSVVELTEMPGYKTAWHRHNNCEESFYVVEGILTVRLGKKTTEMPAGSYISIPRGTPHGQGNFSATPVRLLTTFTPGGFDEFFRDRVELFKTVKPGDATFRKNFDDLRERHKKWVEILGTWDVNN